MASRKNNDILTEILTTGGSESSHALDELSRFLQQPAVTAQSSGAWPGVISSSKKKKVTHYLAPEIIEKLKEVMPEIERLFPGGHNGRTWSRSALLETALLILVHDFEHQREYSLLAQWIQENSLLLE